MMKYGKGMIALLAMGGLIAALAGCQKNEGPGERAGKAMDNAGDKAGQQMEKAGDKMKDAAKDAKK